jgi:hypothetical protein
LTNISARGGGQRKKGKKKNRENKREKLFKNLSTHLTELVKLQRKKKNLKSPTCKFAKITPQISNL